MEQRTRNAWLLLLATILLLAVGTEGYHLIEGWSWYDAFYMTVITVGTVGFGEIHPLGDAGRALTIVLIGGGIGVIGIAATSFTALLVSGEIQQALRDRRMEKRIQHMNGHTILCGYGRIGKEIAREFHEKGKSLVVVDANREHLNEALAAGHLTVEGDATEEEVLLRANVDSALGLIAALPRDSDNLYVTLTAREHNLGLHIAARCLEPGSEQRLLKAGADRVVNPHVIGGKRLAAVMMHPEIMDFLDFSMKQDAQGLSMRHLTVGSHSPLTGQTVAEADLRTKGQGILLLGVSRMMEGKRQIVIPTGATRFEPGDTLILLGNALMYDALGEQGIRTH